MWLKGILGDEGNILYLDYGGHYTSVHVCQVTELYGYQEWILMYVNLTQ